MKTIILDTRENDNDFIAYLGDAAQAKGYSVHMEALSFGDIKYEDIVIERKEINDFCSSVCSDRMTNQIFQMKANSDYNSIIALSGTYDQLWRDNKDKIPRLDGALKQIMAWGIPVMHCMNDEELVDRILVLFDYARPIDVPIKRVDKDSKLSMFMALPHVGRKAAKKLMKEYDNMAVLCTATKSDLTKSLGPKKGADVYDALRK